MQRHIISSPAKTGLLASPHYPLLPYPHPIEFPKAAEGGPAKLRIPLPIPETARELVDRVAKVRVGLSLYLKPKSVVSGFLTDR